MNSNLRALLVVIVFISFGLACGTTLPSYNEAPADDYNNGEDAAAENEPADAVPPPATQELPTTTPEPTGTPGVFIPVTGGGGEGAEATPMVVRMDLNTVYEQVIAGLPQGSALFNPPQEMRLGEAHTVEVRVVPVTEEEIEDSDEIKATLTTDLEGEQEVLIIPLRVSTVMKAHLSGEAFDIVPHMEEEQIKSPDAPYLRWLWDVTPQKTGEQRLILTLTVVVNAEGIGEKPHVTTEIRSVNVGGNPVYSVSRFMGSNWEWVITGLLFPAFGWGWKKLRGRKKMGVG